MYERIGLLFHRKEVTDYPETSVNKFVMLLTLPISIILDNDQLDTQLLYFTIRLL